MNEWGHRLQVLIGLWVIASLIVLGGNGYALMSLLDEPLAGYSSGVRQVNRGFQQYRQMLSAKTEKILSGMESLSQRFAAKAPDVAPAAVIEKENPAATVEKKVNRPTILLPVLTGIVTRRTSAGQVSHMALLNSGVYAEGERLQDFSIRRITAEGVILAKGNQTWFLKRPEIGHSLSQQ